MQALVLLELAAMALVLTLLGVQLQIQAKMFQGLIGMQAAVLVESGQEQQLPPLVEMVVEEIVHQLELVEIQELQILEAEHLVDLDLLHWRQTAVVV
jgi:hypothetical protein